MCLPVAINTDKKWLKSGPVFVVCAIRTEVTYSDFHREVFVVCAIRTELVPPSKVKTLYLLFDAK